MNTPELKEALDFLSELAENNNKAWMDENRTRYKLHRARFEAFVEELIDAISAFDPTIKGLTAKDCTYRMNRDIRFAADKSPYKTHFSAFIAPRGKNSGYAGYYIHLEPEGKEGLSMIGRSILAAGQVCIPPVILRSIREEIVDNGDEMMQNIAAAKGFTLDNDTALKRVPTGFVSGTPYDELLKLKDHCLSCPLSQEELQSADFKKQILSRYQSAKPYLDQLNRAIQYGYEEMM
ncbi:MAG: DUF2461 domain-containing protein [Rikenellaceae bacterium]|nr:DUF2461 domain-containing protein [Rikenellaceae bacterium]